MNNNTKNIVYDSGRFDNFNASKLFIFNNAGTFAYSGPSHDRAVPNYKMNGTITRKPLFEKTLIPKQRMAEITCRVIPEPELSEGRVVLKQEPPKKSPYFDDNGPDSHHCGNCNFVLAKNVDKDWIQSKIHTEGGLGLVLVCPECKSYNEVGPDIG